jgi:regulator of RNase E activity RraA
MADYASLIRARLGHVFTRTHQCSKARPKIVAPGDLVVADDTGVCFIPRDVVLEVLVGAEKKAEAEATRCKAIDDGIPVPDISRATYGEKKT